MILKLRFEDMKDGTNKKRHVMMATLITDIPGMESINTVGVVPKNSIMGKEVAEIITDMLTLKQVDIKQINKQRNETRKLSK